MAVAGAAGCDRPAPVDLLRAEGRLQEARAGAEKEPSVRERIGRPLRINDVVRRTLPAGPPSRYLFALDVPRGGRLNVACAIAPEFHDRPGVEFTVKIREGGREDTLFT